MTTATGAQPDINKLVAVRGQKWIVSDVDPVEGSTLVTLQSMEDGRYGETLDVIWEVEAGARVLPGGSLPEVTERGFDPPERLAAFLDAVRWSAATSADVKTLQAPYRSGVVVEDYQLEPVARAVDAPRVNLLLADDVGLGKTIEAGLVAQELLLRHRARTIMIVCPAGLTVKWRDEMDEKFGLDFTIINTAECARVRATHGSAANPFEVHQYCIVSLPWLRGQKAQRLLDEVLPVGGPSLPRTFDLLILDEAHHVAPAAPQQAYAVDSQQTKLIRKLAPHFNHRLFLSATPHNGYPASFTALLEILDDQRFARGAPPEPAAVADTVVRRLKTQITETGGAARFRKREAHALPLEYPQEEVDAHAKLAEFSALRRRHHTRARGKRSVDLVTLLLKKRMFSSPSALARTVAVYLETTKAKQSTTHTADDDIPEWMADFWDDTAVLDDDDLVAAEDDAVTGAVPLQESVERAEVEILEWLGTWANQYGARPDAKASELLKFLRATCVPDGKNWLNERVVVFTEYQDTLQWLFDLLSQEGMTQRGRVEVMHGGVDQDERERIRLGFQKDPTEHPVRILLATDAAGEGIDLQNHCHRLVNYDIPFNPNKLEQRIGRIDRYGQRETPLVYNFVGVGSGEYDADMEFLSRVARKITDMRADLGPVNAVISRRVQQRLLGDRVGVDDVTEAEPKVPAESDVSKQVAALRKNLDDTVSALGITPDNIKRVVDTALTLARQQPLTPVTSDHDPDADLWRVPVLTGSWVRATRGLIDKLDERGDEARQRPVTFDPGTVAELGDDVVFAHLNHPLVAMSTELLRAAMGSDRVDLHRVTAVVSDDPALETTFIGACTRFVLIGGDGVRLHEEVLRSGGWAPREGRFRRLENLGAIQQIMTRAFAEGTPASELVRSRLVELWPRMRDGLLGSIDWRRGTRINALEGRLATRQRADENRITENIEVFARTLRTQLDADASDDENALFGVDEIKDPKELAQRRKDRENWQRKLDQLDGERDRELSAIAHRYANPRPHTFPMALVFVVPRREAAQ